MSSIIDALKKSDSNRNSETGKNINQVNFTTNNKKPSRKGFWLLVVLLLLTAFGVFAWQQEWHHDFMSVAKGWFKTEQTVGIEKVTEVAKPETKAKPNTAENKLTPPSSVQVRERSNNNKQTKNQVANNNRDAAHDSEQPTSDQIVPRDGKAQNQAERSKATAEDQLTVVKNNLADKQQKQQPDKPNKKEANSKQQANNKRLKPVLQQDYLLVHQLDFEIRKNIPPIKLNIHIYDPLPENRLIMMNGVKYQTGDVIEEIVTVEEINKEGVVLKFENIKFLIPK